MPVIDIPFIKGAPSSAPALNDDEQLSPCSFHELSVKSLAWRERLSADRKQLIFLFIENKISGVQAFLGAISSGHAVVLLDPELSAENQISLVNTYQPEKIITPKPDIFDSYLAIFQGELTLLENDKNISTSDIHPDLTVLLSTSGSTGSPKFVRLTLDNVVHNASVVANVLNIKSSDIATGHLALHYSYGLSILTSFLNSHSMVSLTKMTFMDRGFWKMINERQISHLPGVPFHYQMMAKLRFERLKLDGITVLTQAGGNLDVATRKIAHEFMSEKDGAFHVMYGQTEASPRITTLSHEDFHNYPGSVGTALPGGQIEIVGPNNIEVATGEKGEIFYKGPNVMMGYAENRTDLSLGDVNEGILKTGDIGYLNEKGLLYITGRSKRVGKVYGWRINLDEVESYIAQSTLNAVLQIGDSLKICIPFECKFDQDALLDRLESKYSLPRRIYHFVSIKEIPTNTRNKTDYNQLELEMINV
ncbi:MAG: AMP-binding protein [Aliivibrio sp.]|uniref:AMP-binding protein n=1 Tax=Aliivibrio sp. TaxID=1872443 RepID=UPI001A466B90|nr:AMP-binding protein [Aliivibrio sp.]